MPERPRPNLDRVREAMTAHDAAAHEEEQIPESEGDVGEEGQGSVPEPGGEDDGDA